MVCKQLRRKIIKIYNFLRYFLAYTDGITLVKKWSKHQALHSLSSCLNFYKKLLSKSSRNQFTTSSQCLNFYRKLLSKNNRNKTMTRSQYRPRKNRTVFLSIMIKKYRVKNAYCLVHLSGFSPISDHYIFSHHINAFFIYWFGLFIYCFVFLLFLLYIQQHETPPNPLTTNLTTC